MKDVTFTLGEGTITALVGPSGSGKTTLATLLAKFDDPDLGTITLGGVPLQHVEDLYTHVGFVLQQPQLPSISIRDNIALGRPDATDEEIREAARAAQILDDIEALPSGMDSIYGPEIGLSGGQAQCISIARAILTDAPVLILDEATALTDPESQHHIQQALVLLDEATSALDPQNEAAVVQGIRELTEGKTVLVVAHRLATIRHADQILFLDGGRIVEHGTHDELLATGGRYAAFWHERSRATGWRLASAH